MKYEPIKDQYWTNRHSCSTFLNIICGKCNSKIAVYQKDGPGELKRMYVDRIRETTAFDIKNPPTDLVCNTCSRLIATKRIYPKENRLCYIMFAYTFVTEVL